MLSRGYGMEETIWTGLPGKYWIIGVGLLLQQLRYFMGLGRAFSIPNTFHLGRKPLQ